MLCILLYLNELLINHGNNKQGCKDATVSEKNTFMLVGMIL
jgi:hypothetical protein